MTTTVNLAPTIDSPNSFLKASHSVGPSCSIGEKIALFAYCFFQVMAALFSFHFKELYWNCKNFTHLKRGTAFLATTPPLFNENHDFNEPFSELLKEYQTLQGISNNPGKVISQELKQGFCHAEALTLVQLVKEAGTTLSSQIPLLSSHSSQVTLLEILEIFRHTFETHNREDLLQKLHSLHPQGMSVQKNYQSDQRVLCCEQDLQGFKGLIITRLYNDSTCHTILLSLDPVRNQYGFYNPAFLSGYYEYASLDSFVKALEEHAACQSQYSQWQLSFYPLE